MDPNEIGGVASTRERKAESKWCTEDPKKSAEEAKTGDK